MEIIWLILIGLIGGIIGGMGMGGGTITIPMLVIFLNFEQHIAQCINLLIFLPMAIIAIIIHLKNGLIDFKKSIIIIIPAVITSILGALLAQYVDSKMLGLIFGVFLIVLGIIQFFSILKMKNNKTLETTSLIEKRIITSNKSIKNSKKIKKQHIYCTETN